MLHRILSLVVLGLLAMPSLAQEDKMVETVKGLVKKVMDATVEGNYSLVLDMTYPKVLEMMGGKAAALKEVEKSMNLIKAQGFTFKLKEIGNPTVVTAGKEHYSVTSFTLNMTGQGKKITAKSAVIGISSDAGKTWSFINLDDKGEKGLRKILPNLPADLVIPKQEQKVEDN